MITDRHPTCPRQRLRGNILLVPLTDTLHSARAVQLKIQRAMSGEQRLLLAFEMSGFARDLAKARLCVEHPDWNDNQVALELIRLAFLPAPLPAPLR